jgi:hypothetical protein
VGVKRADELYANSGRKLPERSAPAAGPYISGRAETIGEAAARGVAVADAAARPAVRCLVATAMPG